MGESPRIPSVDVVLDPRLSACPDLGDVIRFRESGDPALDPCASREGDVFGSTLMVDILRSLGETIVGQVANGAPVVAVSFGDPKRR